MLWTNPLSVLNKKHTLRSRHQDLLGTVIELKVVGRRRRHARLADRTVIAQIERLESIFTAFDEDSDLSRYQRGASGPLAPELEHVLDAARYFQRRSEGAFNPAAGALSELWTEGVRASTRPDPAELRRVAAQIADPDGPQREHLTLNAVAKGYIVDTAIDRALQLRPQAEAVTVSAGGDVAHRGTGSAIVGIEDPLRPHDNAKPLMRIDLANAALATSGSAHRGFEIGDDSYSHVIDPRTGEPVDSVASASVVATDAMTADALATTLTVIGPAEAADSPLFADHAWMTVGRDGEITQTKAWTRLLHA